MFKAVQASGKAKVRRIRDRHLRSRIVKLGGITFIATAPCLFAQGGLKVSIDQSGVYSIAAPGVAGLVLSASPAILVVAR